MAAKVFILHNVVKERLKERVLDELNGFSPSLIIFFASSVYEPLNPAQEISKAAPKCRIIGCTSHSEFCNGTFGYNSIAVMALDRDTVEDVHIEVVENASDRFPLDDRVEYINDYFGGAQAMAAEADRYVGIILFDAASKVEEPFLESLRGLTSVEYVGGTDSEASNNTARVYANGKGYADAVVLATLKTRSGYSILKTQSAERFYDKPLKVTRADLKNRIIYELDGRPTAEVYANILNVPVSEIAGRFAMYPLGEYIKDEVYLRTFKNVEARGSISLHCGVETGAEVYVMCTGDIVRDTRALLDDALGEKAPTAVINFTCAHCTMAMLDNYQIKDYSELWKPYPCVGLSCFGEAYLRHINQTTTVLVLW